MRLRLTAQAELDLIEIWQFIAVDNPPAASALLIALDAYSQQLCTNPELGVLREDIARDMRCLIYQNYLILYRVTDEYVEVVRYLHGARHLDMLSDLI